MGIPRWVGVIIITISHRLNVARERIAEAGAEQAADPVWPTLFVYLIVLLDVPPRVHR